MTEDSLGWSCFGKYLKESNQSIYRIKNKYVRQFKKQTIHGGRVLCLNRKFVASSFSEIVRILGKRFGYDLKISELFEKFFDYNKQVTTYYVDKVESQFSDYRRINKDCFEKYMNKKLANLLTSKECVPCHRMKMNYIENVGERSLLKNEIKMVKTKDHNGVDDVVYSKKIKSRQCHLGSFIQSHLKSLMKDVFFSLDGNKNNKIYCSDTDSIYIHKNGYKLSEKKGMIGKEVFQSKNDYGNSAGIVYVLFWLLKLKIASLSMKLVYYLKKLLWKVEIMTSHGLVLKFFLI